MGFVKSKINKIKSPFLRGFIKPIYLLLLRGFKRLEKLSQMSRIKNAQKQNQRIVSSLKNDNPATIKVAFLVLNASVWKYDSLFNKMLSDNFFDPVIFICPHKDLSEEERINEVNFIKSQFEQLDYPVLAPYDNKNELIDIKKVFNPHIVFFTNPHELSYNIYSIENFSDVLTAYAPYSIMATKKPYLQYDQLFHNLLWRMYNETPIHHKMSKKYSRVNGLNSRVAGSSIYESLKFKESKSNVWKNKEGQKKIIYAPHHTFNDLEEMNFSTVLENGEFLLDMAIKYKNKIHIAFKPHPHLKSKLYEYPYWGKKKTDEFYSSWEELENTQVEEGEYIELFQQSDAMILDSISFITEYLFVDKPALFLFKNKRSLKLFNNYGSEALNCLEWSFNQKSIEGFILRVISEEDNRKEERNRFLNTNFSFRNETFSEFVINDIKDQLITSSSVKNSHNNTVD